MLKLDDKRGDYFRTESRINKWHLQKTSKSNLTWCPVVFVETFIKGVLYLYLLQSFVYLKLLLLLFKYYCSCTKQLCKL